MTIQKIIAMLLSAILAAGTMTAVADTSKPLHHHIRHTGKPDKQALHPECRKYLERRAAWYRLKGNRQELRENRKAGKAFRTLPYAEQKIQCQAAYEAFDDFDKGRFRR
nr:stress response protein [uncultured Neisseria sp.]